MKYLFFDEIRTSDMEKIKKFLDRNAVGSSMGNVFWIEVPKDILNEIQYVHGPCAPHVIGVELARNSVKFELFVRSRTKLQCSCQDYLTGQQRDFIFNYAENMLDTLGIRT